MFNTAITPEMHYDDWARQYDSDVKGWGYSAPDKIVSGIRRYLQNFPGNARLLDVGIGTGLLSDKCRAVRGDIAVTGIDISAQMLALCAARKAADDLHRLDVSQARFPFDDGAFDIAAAAGLMENIENITGVIREMTRVVRPGGLIAFTYMPTSRDTVCEKLAKKLRPGRTAEGRLVMGELNLFRHNPDTVRITAQSAGGQPVIQESFIGYRTYVFMTVRYNLFIGRKVAGLQ